MSQARDSLKRHFDTWTLVLQYGFPAVAIVILGFGLAFMLLSNSPLFPSVKLSNYSELLRGARYGLAGAYVAILLQLGRRTLQHDVTTGGAWWCAAMLVLGPILAGVLALVWSSSAQQTDPNRWASAALYFVAGLSPRRIATAVDIAVRRIFFPETVPTQASRLIAINQIRGITPEIEDRLDEEGIADVNALAMSDPIRLLRTTNFHLRQIVSWIDEATLIVTLPKHWQAVEELGITGAIDLAWFHQDTPLGPGANANGAAAGAAAAGGSPAAGDDVDSLAQAIKFEQPRLLRDAIQRLYEDAQVQLIWALFQFGSQEIDGAAEPATVPNRGRVGEVA